jgi:hypothetical protein
MDAARTEKIDPIEPFLAGLKFPADKDRALEAALHNHAPKAVLDLLEHLQPKNFIVPQDLIEAYDEIRQKRSRPE